LPLNVATDTGDCDPIRVCVDGDLEQFTEFEVNEGDTKDDGSCGGTPIVNPNNFATIGGVVTPPAPVAQVAAAVSEVLPARLPSTDMGPTESNGSGLSWTAALAVTLLALGGLTALMTRRQES
jgi:hypothetical protein